MIIVFVCREGVMLCSRPDWPTHRRLRFEFSPGFEPTCLLFCGWPADRHPRGSIYIYIYILPLVNFLQLSVGGAARFSISLLLFFARKIFTICRMEVMCAIVVRVRANFTQNTTVALSISISIYRFLWRCPPNTYVASFFFFYRYIIVMIMEF